MFSLCFGKAKTSNTKNNKIRSKSETKMEEEKSVIE